MPRPRASASQQVRAYKLRNDGLGATAIFEKLCSEFEDPVSARTISTWLRGFRDLTEEVTNLDAPFEYHRMGEYGLSWEAGGYLMEMWAWATGFWADLAEKLGDQVPPPPTVRKARWWWRIHLVVPEVTKFDVYIWAQAFEWQELLKDVLDEPVDLAGLEAYLAYRQWESAEKKTAYTHALVQERIPSAPNIWGEYLLRMRVREVTGQHVGPLLGYRSQSDHLYALPSQIYLETVQELVAERLKRNNLEAELDTRERAIQELEEQAEQ
jgi:hypothetical protein